MIEDAPASRALELARFQRALGELERLEVGDVVLTGRRTGEPASVCTAGRVIADGELVAVDGEEVGVRITGLRK